MARPFIPIDIEKIKRHIAYLPDTGCFVKLTSDKRGRFPPGFVYAPKNWNEYANVTVEGTSYAAHRLAWALMTGQQPEIVDHINGLRHDNRFCNLRSGTYAENAKNKTRHRKEAGSLILHPDADFH
jgi:hypothetical protein